MRQCIALAVLIAQFLLSFSPLAEGMEKSQLVVLHDDSFTVGSRRPKSDDLLMEMVLNSVTSLFNLDLVTNIINPEENLRNVDLNPTKVEAMVAIGDCEFGRRMTSLTRRIGISSVLAIHTKACKDPKHTETPNAIPLFNALGMSSCLELAPQNNRKHQCVASEIKDLIFSSKRKRLDGRWNRKSTPRNNYKEYLDCIDDDENIEVLLGSSGNPAERGALSFTLNLEKGKRFINGRQMTIATIQRPPLTILTMEGNEIVKGDGFCFSMLDTLAAKFNFTYRLVPPYDGNWGNPTANGSVNGMVGMVTRREVDFAVAGFTITQKRSIYIDFTHPFYDEPSTILIPPPKEEDKLLAFLNPFSWEVWTSLLIAVVTIGPAMWILTSKLTFLPLLYPFYQMPRHPLHKYMWSSAFTLLSQSLGNKIRQTVPARILLGFWWVVNIILIYSYNSNLIAFLTVPKLSSTIDSIEALANQRDILWTYRHGTAHDGLFGEAKPPGAYYKIGQLMREQPQLKVKSDRDGVSSVLNNNMAFIKEKSFLDFAMEEDFQKTGECRLAQVPQLFFSAFFGWSLQKNSSYLPLFNMEILRMSQTGLLAEWRRRFWPKPNKCSGGGGTSGPKPLLFRNIYGHFLLLGCGLTLSFVAFIVEKILGSSKNKNN